MKEPEIKRGEIIIYKAPTGPEIQVKLEKDTVWISAHSIARLFGVNRPAIVKHINNVYKTGELHKKSTCSILEQVAVDGKIRKMNLYNLDTIISVGYRVNSKSATQFRVWATKILKEHLIKGYTINEKRLVEAQEKFRELQEAISLLKEKSGQELLSGQEREILDLLENYSKTLTLLEQYDTEKLRLSRAGRGRFILSYEEAARIIVELKKELSAKNEVGDLFGQEYGEKFKGILGTIRQTFNGKELYPSLEEKAAHLLFSLAENRGRKPADGIASPEASRRRAEGENINPAILRKREAHTVFRKIAKVLSRERTAGVSPRISIFCDQGSSLHRR